MTIEVVKGDLLDAFDRGDVNVIGHCCNAQGKMNSGIAKSIRERYEIAYNRYKSFYDTYGSKILGHSIGVGIGLESDNKVICNLVAQEFYGYDGKRYLNYGALASSLTGMKLDRKTTDVIGFPYLMGWDRAGEDFSIVYEMVEFYFKDRNVKFYRLDN